MLGNTLLKSASRLSPNARFLLGVWALFFLLVALGIHGAPTPALADYWSKRPYTGYVFQSIADLAKKKSLESKSLDQMLMMVPPAIRSDDYFFRFPLALGQLSHTPRFPVINTNYWNGMNMLVQPQWDAPVWHISALARPGTWGYFFLGAQRGVAWHWWFQIFACFTTLYLLLVIILDGDRKLAAFGSFWFCGSAFVACFGYWPTYVTFYGALATLSAYWLLKSEKRWIQMTSGVLLGLTIAGFVMILYPPWQVSLGYLFFLILIGLIIRDRLCLSIKLGGARWKVISIGLAAVVAGIILGAYLSSSWADLKVMADTVYPGRRRITGGRFPFWRVFSGAYNLLTSFEGYALAKPTPGGLLSINPTLASFFYLLFPALLVPLAVLKRWRKSFGLIGWLLLAYLAFVLVYFKWGLPHAVAMITMFSHTTATAMLAVGLMSIILCLRAIQCARPMRGERAGWWEKSIPLAAAAIVGAIFLVPGIVIAAGNNGAPAAQLILAAALAGGVASYFMIVGRARVFCALVAVAVLPIPWAFNSLSTNLDYIYKTELSQKIEELDKQSSTPPLWVCYDQSGGKYLGVLVSVLGGKTVSGIQWPPDPGFWHALDPSRSYEDLYNRFGHVYLHYTDDETVSMSLPYPMIVDLKIRADNPVLKQMGAKYILVRDEAAAPINTNRFPLIYKSPSGGFSIFEIP
jgi:hypothetical protein